MTSSNSSNTLRKLQKFISTKFVPAAFHDKRLRRRGIAAVMTALIMTFLIPVVGLGFDVTLMYLIKSKLATASDAASLAAARSLSRGMTLDDQANSAIDRATTFFNGNYPSGYLASLSRNVTAGVSETAYKVRTVTVNSSVTMPMYFLRTLGYTTTTINAISKTSRRDVNLIMVLDRSGSMSISNSCDPMKNAARSFATQFANGRDRLGLITYNNMTYVAYNPTVNFKSASTTLDTVLSNITCTGGTNTSAAYSEAYNQLVTLNEPGALNLIVFFTDGLPTALTTTAPVKMAADSRYGDGVNPYNNTEALYNMPPSTCKDSAGRSYGTAGWNPSPKRGVIILASNEVATMGMVKEYDTAVNSEANYTTITDSNGCAYNSYVPEMRRDIAYLPDYDSYGNNARCCYKSVESFSSGPYAGYMRPDKGSVLKAVAANAADSAALRARNNVSLNIVTYVIGLGTTSGTNGPDQVLMQRMANDPNAITYDPSKPAGFYEFAPDSSQLSRAFARVASEILRIAQ